MTRLKASADLKERLPVSRAVRPNAFRKVLKLYRFVYVIRPQAADTLVVTPASYSTLTDESLGRLIRFEGLESKFGIIVQ